MAASSMSLAKVFGTVAKTLASKQQVLNQVDTYNHDHGDNMVEVFDVVVQAMKAKKGASPADQLAYASELLRQKESGSAKYYAGGLMQAAQQFEGKQVTPDNAMELIQTLLGGGAPASSPAPVPSGQGNMLGSLLAGLTGAGQTGVPAQGGLDIGDLLNAGMSYMNAKQRGEADTTALMGALMSATSGGNTPYRAQSGAVVANALMQAVGALAAKKR